MIVTKANGGRVNVRIEVDAQDAFAYDGSRQVGEVRTTGHDDLGHGQIIPPTITFMHVDQDYRRNGVGLGLIRALAEEFGMLRPASRNVGTGGINALTDEGEALTRRAQAEGLVTPFPEDQPEDLD